MKKKILVTGSNGLLGQKLVYALVRENYFEVFAGARGENRLPMQSGYVYFPLDISDKNNVSSVIEKVNPDVIINTAAMTNVDACETQREECWSANVTGVQNLVSAVEELKRKNSGNCFFIHLSTDFVFNGMKGSVYTEEDEPDPLSYYALSKLEGEKRVTKSILRWAIVRTIIVFGVADNMTRSNIVLWAKKSLEEGKEINVVDDQFRSPTLAEDLAEGCILLAKKEAEGIFNISGKETMSVLEMVKRIADFWKLDKTKIKPVKSSELSQPAKRPPRTGFDISKARKILGFEPHTLEEGLRLVDNQMKAAKA